MRFSLLVVVAALTSFMSVSATPAVFSRECSADYHPCGQNSQCCSLSSYNSIAVECAILRTTKIPKIWQIARVSHISAFVLESLFTALFLVTC
ncbi:hypothetical protein CY34DRAFT_800657 [Suillus luteus UH-Slu-Lm8-n1]|uniref:Hydrophobin n=1 Tax=Suillus luteus UH-Slu-Lm8-n1 TaxID=930992 RepID=A0A0D0A7S7_9AGAM|nr:hypothetical protein CY34DRAFT_800657 [Suillus luteus UH-Slu-Lm8-n1]